MVFPSGEIRASFFDFPAEEDVPGKQFWQFRVKALGYGGA
jgi:hypothetical protein